MPVSVLVRLLVVLPVAVEPGQLGVDRQGGRQVGGGADVPGQVHHGDLGSQVTEDRNTLY